MRLSIDSGYGRRRVHCRELGTGDRPLLHLHGGWGYGVYPLDGALEALAPRSRVLIPDRIDYGRSERRREAFPLDFHRRAASETLAVMDALAIERAVIWGHSDGACAAVWMGIEAPERCTGLILEALHLDRAKPHSRDFFDLMATNPRALVGSLAPILEADHGDDWDDLLRLEGRAWRAIQETPGQHPDLFDGRLGELRCPTLVLHGTADPRTEPGELEAVLGSLPDATAAVLEGGGHSPHSEPAVRAATATAVVEFLAAEGLL